MNRRQFLSTTAAVSAIPAAQAAPAGKPCINETGMPERAYHGDACEVPGAVRRAQHMRLSAGGRRAVIRQCGRTQKYAGPRPQQRSERGLHRPAVSDQQPHRPRKAPGHHAGAEPRARSRYRIGADRHPQLRHRGSAVHQVQHEHSGRPAHRPHAGPRRRFVQPLAPGRRQARDAAHARRPGQRRPVLGAHHLFSGSRDPGGQRIQSPHGLPSAGSRVCRRKATRAWTACWARWPG